MKDDRPITVAEIKALMQDDLDGFTDIMKHMAGVAIQEAVKIENKMFVDGKIEGVPRALRCATIVKTTYDVLNALCKAIDQANPRPKPTIH